ncbi:MULTISPECIES: ribosomal-processing cysteine protease Prp [Anoxybacillus]|uniref:Ribosomal processing cysteine protease Prp n=1 Tax=Anoxybacillus flavithermus AK1 TaxID=1297581 RepID=M8E040_9BACL|nr:MULTISPECIES: ribosomal-processing cysteine protease Prp [Anoxybacillus]EMT46329.1 hypothetical protein H919_05414 [Anoxybacillus flavithermus AK1]EPZ39700.1 hypothetical protein C289_0321 [Anoxybacillus ayderensis]MBW7650805.1 ribosomal-processing cysteine protease Prp [Anoxybacillus sp. ST4]
MIRITVHRTVEGTIRSFTISGHAHFAKRGQDIVCAGVSAISFGAVNAIIALTNVKPIIQQGKDGYLHCELPAIEDAKAADHVQLLLEGMIVSLQTIERDYGKYVKITTKTV